MTNKELLKEIEAWLSFNTEPSREETAKLRKSIKDHLTEQLRIHDVSKSFTAEEVVNELEDCDTLDDAIMFFKEHMSTGDQITKQPCNIHDVIGSIDSMKKAMDWFKNELKVANEENADGMFIKGANWGYNVAVEQFHNRFAKYYP